MSEDHVETKKQLLRRHAKQIKKKKAIYYKKFRKAKRIHSLVEAVSIGLQSISVSSIVLALMANPVMLFISLGCSSIAGLIAVVSRVIDLPSKYNSYHTSYCQLADLERDINNRLLVNHLSSEDLDRLLSSINTRMGLIDDNSLPIDFSESDSSTRALDY